MKKSLFLLLMVLGVVFLTTSTQSCYYDNEEELYGNSSTICDTSSVKYSTSVQPLMAAQCATSGCHNAATASAGADLSTYTSTKNYITNGKEFFIGSIKHTSGFSQMPKGGSKMATCDITKIELWINAGMPNN
ncbi:MAG: hypothetical protein JNL70_24510 [Saprospiraceae bacterium]|nr:hypothetical protein [Saprospiraceae bacterium]